MKTYHQEGVIEILKKQNISVTIQRIAILEFLLNHPIHPPVEEIYQRIRATFPTISKATVYNTLMALKEVGLVQEITIEKDRARYDGNPMPHGHFFCRTCQDVFDVDADFTLKEHGFDVADYQAYFYGSCPKCAGEAKA